MLEEIAERAVPWGAWVALGALLGAAFPRETKAATKAALHHAFRFADWARGFSAEAYEKGQDIVAEARAEYEQMLREAEREAERSRLRVVASRPGRRRAGPGTKAARRTTASRRPTPSIVSPS